MVGLLEPFVDDRPRPVRGHLRAEDCGLVLEGARRSSIAPSLRDENWNRVVFDLLGQSRITGSIKGVLATPLVCIETEEVDALRGVGATGEIILQVWAEYRHISWLARVRLNVTKGYLDTHRESSQLEYFCSLLTFDMPSYRV